MIAHSFWEAYSEGRNAWGKNKLGWKLKLSKNLSLTAYHFWLFFVMRLLLLTLPLVIYGWNLKLFGILVSAYFSGLVIEDFFWFVVNPKVKLSEFNPGFVKWYPWLKIKRFKVPLFYFIFILIAILSWFFIWK